MRLCVKAAASSTSSAAAAVEVKTEPVDAEADTAAENSASWSILRDDFMIGARMKDWDKQTTHCDDDAAAASASTDSDASDDDDDERSDDCS